MVGHYAPPSAAPPNGELPPVAGAQTTVINLLCPRPELPQGALAVPNPATRLPPPDYLPPSDSDIAVTQLSARK